MFDLFDFQPVDFDPFNPPLPPKRPKDKSNLAKDYMKQMPSFSEGEQLPDLQPWSDQGAGVYIPQQDPLNLWDAYKKGWKNRNVPPDQYWSTPVSDEI